MIVRISGSWGFIVWIILGEITKRFPDRRRQPGFKRFNNQCFYHIRSASAFSKRQFINSLKDFVVHSQAYLFTWHKIIIGQWNILIDNVVTLSDNRGHMRT